MVYVIVYRDVVNVQPRFNFSNEIIILNLEKGLQRDGQAPSNPACQRVSGRPIKAFIKTHTFTPNSLSFSLLLSSSENLTQVLIFLESHQSRSQTVVPTVVLC